MEREISRLATRTHGVVARVELLEAGITSEEIAHRVRIGGLIVELRGVYRVGHRAPSVEARYMAAIKACGAGARLSGLSAAHLFELLRGAAPPPEVTAPTERRVRGVKTHRSRSMDPRDATRWRGIPVTTVPRTLVDLSSELSLDALARACHQARIRHRTTPAQVEAALARCRTAKGAGNLRRVLHGDVHVTLSTLERRFLELLREDDLPLPVTNRPAAGRLVDCRWPAHRLTVELDGYRYHSSRHAWEQDRRREREAHARGDQHRRYTYGDVFEQPAQMLAELRALLGRARASPRSPGIPP